MNYQEYIKSELLVLIPVLYFIGIGLKKSCIADKYIPIILGVISVTLSSVWTFATVNYSTLSDISVALFTAVTQGILLAGTSVYANQIYVQTKKNE